MTRYLLLLAFLPLPVLADAALIDRYRAPVDACYAQAQTADDLEPCKGRLSADCINDLPNGGTTLDIAQCLHAEHAYWDEWLNREYAVAINLMRETDQFHRDTSPRHAVGEERLRAAQRAWIAFRDADCLSRLSIWAGGSFRNIVYPGCLSERTFERVQDLIRLREH